ncbi:hypothetical protein AAG906_005879 [Vitis piasezkii]
MEEDIFCHIHEGGEVVEFVDGSVQYKGGRTESIVVSGNITHVELVSKVCGELNIDPNLIKLEFTVKFDPSCLLPLHDETTVVKMFRFNDMFCRVYVSPHIEVGEGLIAQTRFRYSFTRNTPKHMTVVCTITQCPWKVTAHAIGDSKIVQVHTFRNVHNHSLEDVSSSQPLIRSNRASLVIDDVIRSTPNYQPSQICKDFVRQHGMQLTYLQAWQMKEKAKECIYGQLKYYYKLLPWMCDKMVTTNPGTVVELHYSSDEHFQQLFVAHAVLIQGFALGCRSVIAIDSSHMSGPYEGALFSATAYDANDSMFPLAFSVMIVAEKEVVIISDRHPALLRSVPEVFGLENHAYCYRHLKENFSTFVSKQITKGNKGKENALQFLNSIAYARHERHHSICNFLMEHMAKLGFILVKHKEQSNNWKGSLGPQIEENVLQNIAKGEVYPGWQMFRIPCEHATTVILSIGHNVADFVDECYKFPMQELIYAGSFSSIETHDMLIVDDHGVVRSITGQVFLSLKPPHTKGPPGRPKKKRIESQFQDKQTVHCSRCHMSGHNRKTCKNPLS